MALNLGTTAIGALYLGSTAISTAYLGSVQVYDAGGAAFDPVSLFASGEEGALFLPGPTTCFTDTAGTTAAGAGDSVARINDTSGNGNHATQATAAARPVLQQTAGGLWYLDFDGVDDGMATASIDFTSTDKMSVFAGVEKDSESQVGFILETSNNFSFNTGSLYMAVNSSSGTVDYEVTSRGTATAVPALLATSDDAQPALAVISATHDISGDSSVLRVNGAQVDEAMADQGAGNFGDYPLNIGARNNAASVFFDGRIYGLIVRGATSTAQEISDTETFLAARSGVTL